MTVAEVVARFEGVRLNAPRDAAFFTCPVCAKQAFAAATNGRVVLTCPSGCSADQMLAANASVSHSANGAAPTLPNIINGSAEVASVPARPVRDSRDIVVAYWEDQLLRAARQLLAMGEAKTQEELAQILMLTAFEKDVRSNILQRPPELRDADDNELEGIFAHVAEIAWAERPNTQAVALYETCTPVEAYSTWAQISTEAREYAWDGLIRFGGSAGVSGLMGAGKTTLMLNVVRGWALGEPVLDRIAKPSRTLVVASPKEIDNWLETIHHWGLQHKVWVIESTKVQLGGHQKTADWFAWAMRQFECRTFALDTLFDFFGMPANNSGDQNRIVMNEQNALLSVVRSEKYAGIVGGHQPKSEAKTLDPRDAEEAFSGNTGWMAQHRMRISLRRKSKGFTSIITGRGGYGDRGITEEQFLNYNESTRIQTLGGPWSKHLGEAAVGPVVAALTEFGDWASRLDMEKKTGLSKHFILAGLKLGKIRNLVEDNDLSTNKKAYRAVTDSELKNSSLYKE